MTISEHLKNIYEEFVVGTDFEPLVQPRRISPPAGYAPVHQVAAQLYTSICEATAITRQPTPTINVSAVTVAYAVMREKVPIYYVSEAFIRAVAATEIPNDIWIADLHWPREALVLAFPRSFMLEFVGREIGYVLTANIKAGVYDSPLPSLPCTEVPFHKFGVFYMIGGSGRTEASVAVWKATDRIAEASSQYPYLDYTDATAEQVEEFSAILNKIANLILKLLLILGMRNGFVIEGQQVRPQKIKNGKIEQHALFSPNIIGGVYRPKIADGGTHAGPGLHWRIGHVTHQAVGGKHLDFISAASLPRLVNREIDWANIPAEVRVKFWTQHKRIWLDPVLVGGKSKETVDTENYERSQETD